MSRKRPRATGGLPRPGLRRRARRHAATRLIRLHGARRLCKAYTDKFANIGKLDRDDSRPSGVARGSPHLRSLRRGDVNLNGGWVACNTHDATNNRNTHDAAPTLQQDVTQDAPHKMQKVATTRCSRGDATQELQQTVASLSDCGTGPGRASCDEARCMGSVTAYESDSRPCHGAQFCAKQ